MPFLVGMLALGAEPTPLEGLLVQELDRAREVLADQPEQPHYIALSVEDWAQVNLAAQAGTLHHSREQRARYLDVDLRVGDPHLDSTRQLRGFSALEGDSRRRVQVALDDGYALRHTLWRELNDRYRDAAERIVVVRANLDVKVEEESPADDFEVREPVVDREDVPPLEVDRTAWEPLLIYLSGRLEQSPVVHHGAVSLDADRVVKTFVDTEGTRLIHGRRHARVSITAATTAPDGDNVQVFVSKDVHDLGSLPSPEALNAWTDEVLQRLTALRDAPRGSPYSGPVLLKGRAAGVFFHEVLGHRVEGHRQKREDEGKTFADHIGRPILPDFIDVYDDPTLPRLAGEDLNGHYRFDDEGVPAQRALLVDDGVFVGFLTSRSPIPGFPTSNGHGRRSTGNPPVARMGSTIIESSRTFPEERLREMLLEQVRRQGLAYGYIVDDIDGGFTLTGRTMPNAFNVRANTTWRVYADGRPDELVRGIDLVGTPLVAFGNLIATGDQPAVFNGVCGAESGWVPVSAVAPSLLFSKLEFQLKEKGQERPPLLAKPVSEDGAADGGGE